MPSAWICNRGESERFLYYHGPTLAPSCMDAALDGDRLTWSVSTAAREFFTEIFASPLQKVPLPQSAILIRRHDGRLSGQVLVVRELDWSNIRTKELPTPMVVDLPADNLHDNQVPAAFRNLLTAAGLTAAEAEGLVQSWESHFFQTDGRRIVMLMKQAAYNTFCPIKINPPPTELVRVGIVLTEF